MGLEIILVGTGAAVLGTAAVLPDLTRAERCQLAVVGIVMIVNTLGGGLPVLVGLVALRKRGAKG